MWKEFYYDECTGFGSCDTGKWTISDIKLFSTFGSGGYSIAGISIIEGSLWLHNNSGTASRLFNVFSLLIIPHIITDILDGS